MSERKLAFIYAPEVERLVYPPDCPFKTQRAGQMRSRLFSFGLLGSPGLDEIAPRRATRAEIERFHSPRYLDELERAAAGDLTVEALQMGLGTADTPVFKDMVECGAWACGASLTGAELILAGKADFVFNPVGGLHHAMAEKAAGFCYLNDIVLACMKLAEAGKRVLFLDVDAHHGDGVQAAFYGRRDVMTISFHESGKTLFPWGGFEDEIGEGDGRGYNVNVPLPAGTYDEAYLRAFRAIVPPLARAYGPDAVVLELGMDTLAGDPLTHLSLTNNAIAEVVREVMRLQKPVLAAGGGGYHIENTVRGWALAWKTFAGEEDEHDLSMGMGGVMLASSEWAGGLRDHELPASPDQRRAVEPAIEAVIAAVRKNIFPLHGLDAQGVTGK
jgi:acetoin utilization protein AcuC